MPFPVEFLLRNQLTASWEFLVCYLLFSLAFSILSLPLIFVSLITVSVCSSLGLSFLGLSVLPGLGWLPFPCSGSVQLFSSNIFLGPFSLCSPSGTPYNMNVGAFNVVQEISGCLHFFWFSPLFSVLWHWFPPFCPPGHLSILLP